MGSSKGTRVLDTNKTHEMGGAPKKLEPETPHPVKGITAFHLGTSTFVVIAPMVKKVGLVCTKNDEESVKGLKVGFHDAAL